MGRITIFALVDCPHCKRTKSALKERNIPYTEISLTTHPEKRSDMLALADRLTVPQVFFNETHIGGADDTLTVLKQWDEDSKYSSALEKYEHEIKSKPDPTDPRLAVPTTPPFVENPPPPRNETQDSIPIPSSPRTTTAASAADGESQSVLEVTQTLMEGMPKADLKYIATIYKKSFKGSDGVSALMNLYNIPTRDEAVQFGLLLQSRHILHHVTGDHKFGDNAYYYRLQPHHTPNILNTFRIWTDRVDSDSMALAGRLKKLLGKVESAVTDEEGNVDYIAATRDPNYIIFEEAVCELQGTNFESMSSDMKLAFGINIYNFMIKYAFMKAGIGSTNFERASFFNNVSFNIGGHILSFSELENGVLRANSRAPYQISLPFGKKDDRRRLALDQVDPRIHFALNCGAKSCPPVKKFSAGAIDEELRIVAMAFSEQDDNVGIDEEKYELNLSMILNWYRPDFADSPSKLPEKVVTFLRGEKKEKLQRMIDNSSRKIKVSFNHYDWSTNASKHLKYKASMLNVDEKSVKALVGW